MPSFISSCACVYNKKKAPTWQNFKLIPTNIKNFTCSSSEIELFHLQRRKKKTGNLSLLIR